MATGIKELVEPYRVTAFDITDDITGQRAFVYDPDDTVDHGIELPVVGEKFPNYEWLYCLSMDEERLGGHPDKKKYTAKYGPMPWELENTPRVADEEEEPRNTDNARRSVSIGGEMYALENTGSSITWCYNDEPVGDDVRLMKRIVTGTIGLETETEEFEEFNARVQRQVGKINANKFLGYDAGLLLFSGARMEQSRFLDADLNDWKGFWKVTLSFSFRIIQDGGDQIGWQYHWNPTRGEWDCTDPKTYETSANFDQLL